MIFVTNSVHAHFNPLYCCLLLFFLPSASSEQRKLDNIEQTISDVMKLTNDELPYSQQFTVFSVDLLNEINKMGSAMGYP